MDKLNNVFEEEVENTDDRDQLLKDSILTDENEILAKQYREKQN